MFFPERFHFALSLASPLLLYAMSATHVFLGFLKAQPYYSDDKEFAEVFIFSSLEKATQFAISRKLKKRDDFYWSDKNFEMTIERREIDSLDF